MLSGSVGPALDQRRGVAGRTPHLRDARSQEASELIREGAPIADIVTKVKIKSNPARYKPLKGDIYAAALEGVVDAACRFDPSRGVPFRSYVRHRIWGSISDWLRTMDHVSKHYRALAERTGLQVRRPLSIDEIPEERQTWAHPGRDPFANCCYVEMVAVIEQAIKALPDRKRAALALRYREGWKFPLIASALGYTESRACQVIREAHEAIRNALTEAGFDRR